MPNSADQAARDQPPRCAGAVHRIDASSPLRLDRLSGPFIVRLGYVDLFAVPLTGGEATGARRHVLRVEAGGLVCALPTAADIALVAVGSLDAAIEEMPGVPPRDLTSLLEAWMSSIGEAVFGSTPAWPDRVVAPGPEAACAAGTRLYAGDAPVWVRPLEGRIVQSFDPGEIAVEDHGSVLPLVAALHARAVTSARFAVVATADLPAGEMAASLEEFHRRALDGISRQIARLDEASHQRLLARRAGDDKAMSHAVSGLGALVDGKAAAATGALAASPLLAAFAAVAQSLGSPVQPAALSGLPEISLASLGRVTGFAYRRVLLRGAWWRADNGPLIGYRMPDQQPVALLPGRRGGYRLVDGPSGEGTAVTGGVAAHLAVEAVMLYPPLPAAARKAGGFARFAFRGSLRDVVSILTMGLLAGALGSVVPIATGFLFERVVPRADMVELVAIIAGLVLATFGAASFELVKAIALQRLEARAEGLLQPAIMQRLLDLPVGFFRGFGTGDLTDRILGVQRIRRLITGTTIASLLAVGFSITSFAVILAYSPPLALLSAALVAVAVAIGAGLGYAQLRHERVAVERGGREDALVIQLINGVGKLRVSASEARLFALWAGLFAGRKAATLAGRRYANLRATFYGSYPTLALMLLFLAASRSIGGHADGSGSGLPLGGFLAISTAFGQFLAAMIGGAGALTTMVGAMPLFERLHVILETEPEKHRDRVDPGTLTGAIEVSHVSFRYDPAGPLVLDDISLRIEPGQFVAIVGASGSGKSTLSRLLLGLETPESGDILYQGQSLATLDISALRRRIGVVLQNTRAMSGSIFETITGGLPFSLEDAWDAARMAGIAADIEAMPMGMHTVLMEGAVTLSGGQMQRLMIARALVARPQLLIFDEATSALDNATQAVVTASLSGLHVTRILIAHRLTTIRSADLILVLDRGRLVEAGDFESLMLKDGVFHALARRQMA